MITVRRPVTVAIAAAGLGIAGVGLAVPADAAATPGVPTSWNQGHSQGKWQRRLPAVAVEWSAAWNSGDPKRLAALFVESGARYTDHAFGTQDYLGRAGVIEWATHTEALIQGANVDVDSAFSCGDFTVIDWRFSGRMPGAPRSFSVPAVTVLTVRGHQIVTDDDYYSKDEVLSQSYPAAVTSAG